MQDLCDEANTSKPAAQKQKVVLHTPNSLAG
jgi:hypothetical protein